MNSEEVDILLNEKRMAGYTVGTSRLDVILGGITFLVSYVAYRDESFSLFGHLGSGRHRDGEILQNNTESYMKFTRTLPLLVP